VRSGFLPDTRYGCKPLPRFGSCKSIRVISGWQAAVKFYGLKAVACFAQRSRSSGMILSKSDEALSHDVMVVYYQGPDSICHAFIPFRSITVLSA